MSTAHEAVIPQLKLAATAVHSSEFVVWNAVLIVLEKQLDGRRCLSYALPSARTNANRMNHA